MKHKQPAPDYYSQRELAKLLGVNDNTVRRQVALGRIPDGQRVGCTIVYTREQAQQIAEWWRTRKIFRYPDSV